MGSEGFSRFPSPQEGTGTRPDYLVNRDDQKNQGRFGELELHKNREIIVG